MSESNNDLEQILGRDPKPSWNHGICERCWFTRTPTRFPLQLRRQDGDLSVDRCCFCGTLKLTRIFVRHDPKDTAALSYCYGLHDDED